jgi:hypothetical protein
VDESTPDAPCSGKIYDESGRDVTFTVTHAGTFEFVAGPPAGKKIPIIAELSIKDGAGKALVQGADETALVDLQPGTYSVNVKDSIPGDVKHFKGGFSFELRVKRTAIAPDPVPVASAAVSGTTTLTHAEIPKPAAKAAGSAAKPTAKPAGSAKKK